MKLLSALTVALTVALVLTGCAGRYSTYAEQAFLVACENRGTVSFCNCNLNFLEATVPEGQLEADGQQYLRTGVLPGIEQTAASVCRVAA